MKNIVLFIKIFNLGKEQTFINQLYENYSDKLPSLNTTDNKIPTIDKKGSNKKLEDHYKSNKFLNDDIITKNLELLDDTEIKLVMTNFKDLIPNLIKINKKGGGIKKQKSKKGKNKKEKNKSGKVKNKSGKKKPKKKTKKKK